MDEPWESEPSTPSDYLSDSPFDASEHFECSICFQLCSYDSACYGRSCTCAHSPISFIPSPTMRECGYHFATLYCPKCYFYALVVPSIPDAARSLIKAILHRRATRFWITVKTRQLGVHLAI